jgi:TolA-binding protein
LLEIPGDNTDSLHKKLYFQIGLGNLLGVKYVKAEEAFKNCIERFPKGEYTFRAYLGLGRACMMQKQPEKKEEALAALKKAATEPKCKTEAERLNSVISHSLVGPDKINPGSTVEPAATLGIEVRR